MRIYFAHPVKHMLLTDGFMDLTPEQATYLNLQNIEDIEGNHVTFTDDFVSNLIAEREIIFLKSDSHRIALPSYLQVDTSVNNIITKQKSSNQHTTDLVKTTIAEVINKLFDIGTRRYTDFLVRASIIESQDNIYITVSRIKLYKPETNKLMLILDGSYNFNVFTQLVIAKNSVTLQTIVQDFDDVKLQIMLD